MKNGKAPKRILSVTIKRMVDDSPDTSWLGEYANRPTSEYSIDRAHSEDCQSVNPRNEEALVILSRVKAHIETSIDAGEASEESVESVLDLEDSLADCDCGERGDMERNQYRYFNPSFNYVDSNGHALPENTAEEVRSYVKQDYERMESLNAGHWCFIGIRAEAKITIPDKTCIGLDSYHIVQKITSGGLWGIESDSGKSYIEETEQEQLAELREQLKAIGFSSRAISTAFKNVERKED